MENLISELYYGNICPVEQMEGATSEKKERGYTKTRKNCVRPSMSRETPFLTP